MGLSIQERIAKAIEARAASYCLSADDTANPEILGSNEGRIAARIYELNVAAQIARETPDQEPERWKPPTATPATGNSRHVNGHTSS